MDHDPNPGFEYVEISKKKKKDRNRIKTWDFDVTRFHIRTAARQTGIKIRIESGLDDKRGPELATKFEIEVNEDENMIQDRNRTDKRRLRVKPGSKYGRIDGRKETYEFRLHDVAALASRSEGFHQGSPRSWMRPGFAIAPASVGRQKERNAVRNINPLGESFNKKKIQIILLKSFPITDQSKTAI